MKRTALAIALILALSVSLMVGVQFVKVVEADPFFMFKNIDLIPGTIPPTITMFSPLNNTEYSSDKITVSFNVIKPQLAMSWTSIMGIHYRLDNNEEVNVNSFKYDEKALGAPEFKATFTLPSLPAGNHSLTVRAHGLVTPGIQYDGYNGQYKWSSSGEALEMFHLNGTLAMFYIDSTSTTFFTIAEETEPEPSPTTLVATVIGASLAVIGIGLLVYFKKRKH
jgi:hypothetical protein